MKWALVSLSDITLKAGKQPLSMAGLEPSQRKLAQSYLREFSTTATVEFQNLQGKRCRLSRVQLDTEQEQD